MNRIPYHQHISKREWANPIEPELNEKTGSYSRSSWPVVRCAALFGRWCVLLLFFFPLAPSGSAQQTNIDGVVPPGLAPGAPAGSYILSDFEQINMYNGHINLRIPLFTVGGRGGAGYTIFTTLTNPTWMVENDLASDTCPPSPGYCPTWITFPTHNWWGGGSGYGPGSLLGRRAGSSLVFCVPDQPWGFAHTITTLVFTSPDGTETVLYDQGYACGIRNNYCGGIPPNDDQNRGRVFIAVDGSGMTFVSDENIYDYAGTDLYSLGYDLFYPSGLLKLKDGVVYVIKNSYVTTIRDRNGNELNLSYAHDPPSYPLDVLLKITDSLNREVNFDYLVNDGSFGLCNRIRYKGFGGDEHTIRESLTSLSFALRSDSTLKNYYELFPQMPSAPPTTYNPIVTQAVWLPDGVRSYSFQYNSYGELAQITLPTTGVITYDYWGGVDGGYASGQIGDPYPPNVHYADPPRVSIYRRLKERKTFPDGINRETRTTYSRAETLSGTTYNNLGYVDEVTKDANNNTLAKTRHYYSGSPYTDLIAHDPVNLFPFQFDGRETKTEVLDSSDVPLRRIEHTWIRASSSEQIQETKTSLLDVSPANVSKQTFEYDQFDNRTIVDEYDFGSGQPGAFKRRSSTTFQTSAAYTDALTGPHIRNLPLSQQVFDASDLGTPASKVTYEYDNYTLGLTNRTDISRHDSAYGTGFLLRGNPTATIHWLLPSTQFTARMQYDIAGNIVSRTDPRGFTTQLFYEDNFGAPNDSNSQVNTPPSELSTVNQKSYALLTKVINAGSHTSYSQYSYYLGKAVDIEDANGVVTSIYYDDLLERLTQGIRGSNTAIKNQTTFTYFDSTRIVSSTSDQSSYGDNLLHSETEYDPMGRTVESRQYAPEGVIKTRQTYDALNRVIRVTNPNRSTSENTYGYTDTTYDRLGRVARIESFTGSGASTGAVVTAYVNNATTITDQASKVRKSVTDGLGRLTQVIEDPSSLNYSTVYDYDVLDDLIKVTQGDQSRYFMYDSLKQLIRARNPEQDTNANLALNDPLTGNSQWSMKYTYDENSNLATKADSRGTTGITTTYNYDALNRVTSRTYSDSTRPVSFYYDNQTLPYTPQDFTRGASIGRLVAVTYGSGGTNGTYTGSYDAFGRPAISVQRTESLDYRFGYVYNLIGAITNETYPSNRVLTTAYDAAGRIASVIGGGTTYANSFSYTASGAVTSMSLGNGVMTEQTVFNTRLQPTQIELRKVSGNVLILGLDYGFGSTTANNGNIARQTIRIGTSTPIVQDYSYDNLNRLSQATETVNGTTQWQQTYDCDRWGNRAVRSGSYIPQVNVGLTPQSASSTDFSAFDQSTNRLKHIQGQNNIDYDNAGNLTHDSVSGSYAYDAENRLVNFNNGAGQYSYDGDGHRVEKIDSNGTTIFVYNAAGQLIAEYHSDPVPPIPGGGGTSYLTTDHLGSTRVVTKSDGSVKARYDYLPFGEEIESTVGGRGSLGYGAADSTKQKFTQKERDNESGLDYFGARYYSGAQGRFTGVDPLIGNSRPGRPQGWNRYVYAFNNPLRFIDPDGQDAKEALEQAVKKLVEKGGPLLKRWVGSAVRAGEASGFNPVVLAGNLTLELLKQVWPVVRVDYGNLKNADEKRFAHFVAAFEGKSFQGSDEAGIDGWTYKGNVPVGPFGMNDFRLVQLKTLYSPSAANINTEAKDINIDIKEKTTYSGVYAYIEVTNPNVTASSLVKELVNDAPSDVSLVNITRGNYLPQVTFVLNDGIVRVDQGSIFHCSTSGSCSQVNPERR